jgi:hypothetical protein
VEEKVAVGQVFSEYFGFLCQTSFIIITQGWHNRPIGGRSAGWTQLDSIPIVPNEKKNYYNRRKTIGIVVMTVTKINMGTDLLFLWNV